MTKPGNSSDELHFRLFGTRRILELCGDSEQIEHHIDELERAVNTNPGLAIDAAKALIETACKTILVERQQPIQSNWDVPDLVRSCLKILALIPAKRTDSKDTHKGLKKTINGIQTAVQGLCEIRNNEGSVSHGRDAYTQMTEEIQGRFAAQSADAIACFLFSVHREYPGIPEPPRNYGDFSDYDEYLDSVQGEFVYLGDAAYQPSEILFYVDNAAYMDGYYEFQSQQEQNGDGVE
jgi:hypothetical protein